MIKRRSEQFELTLARAARLCARLPEPRSGLPDEGDRQTAGNAPDYLREYENTNSPYVAQ